MGNFMLTQLDLARMNRLNELGMGLYDMIPMHVEHPSTQEALARLSTLARLGALAQQERIQNQQAQQQGALFQQQQALNQQKLQANQLALGQTQTNIDIQNKINQAIQASTVNGKVDLDQLQSNMSKMGIGSLYGSIAGQYTKAAEGQASLQANSLQQQKNMLAFGNQVAMWAHNMPHNEMSALQLINVLKNAGDTQGAQYWSNLYQQNPTAFWQSVDNIAVNANVSKAETGKMFTDPKTGKQFMGTIVPGQGVRDDATQKIVPNATPYIKPATGSSEDREITNYLAAHHLPDTPANRDAALTALLRRKALVSFDIANEVLTPQAIQMLGNYTRTTGETTRTFGRGASSITVAQLNAAANTGNGSPPDLGYNKSQYQADVDSLRALTKQRSVVASFEGTAGKNLRLFLKTAQPVINSGSPIVNTPLRAIAEKGLGSKELAAYRSARQVVLAEIAKVTNNPTLSGQLSDTARKEVLSLVPENATLGQIYSVAKVLLQDMDNRIKSYDEQIGQIQNKIKGIGGQAGGAGNAPGKPPSGTLKVTFQDGSQMVANPDGSFTITK